jgi:hypothetical protein
VFQRKWTYADILVDVHREELDKMAVEMSGSKAGSAAYLGCYKKAIKTIDGRLDEDTRMKYRADAKTWTEQKPPPRQQQRYAHANHFLRPKVAKPHQPRMFEKHGLNTLRDFSESMYCQFGMRVAILGGYCDGDGEPAIMLYVCAPYLVAI